MSALRVSQFDVASQLGISQGTLSTYLAGHRQPPRNFEERLNDALDRLERAERAADEARQRVLAS